MAIYRDLLILELPSTSKGVAAHQTACRAALTHIEQLLRLARSETDMTLASDHTGATDIDLWELLNQARAAIDMTLDDA